MKPHEPASFEDLSAEDREILAHLLRLEGERAGRSGRIERRPHAAAAPMSAVQRGLWIVDHLRGDSAYHLAPVFRARGPLAIDALEASLGEIVRRHDILRTRFEVVDGVPQARIGTPAPMNVERFDLLNEPADRRETRALEIARREIARPFDLARGPLIRCSTIRLSEDESVLVLVLHHIAGDGWSIGVLFRELSTLYAAYRGGNRSPLPELPIQYADFAAWQAERVQGDALRELLAYWREQLEGAPALQLRPDGPRPAMLAATGAHEVVSLDGPLLPQLDEVARAAGATRFMALLAGFAAVLARYGETRDLVVGIPVAGRDHPDTHALIGLFVNVLPARIAWPRGATFRELIARVRDRVLGVYEHQDVAFDVLVESLGIEATPNGNPLFQVAFAEQDSLGRPPDLPGLELESLESPVERTRYDLEGFVLDGVDGARVSFVYNVGVFQRATIRRMLRHFVALLSRCAANPDQPIDAVPLLDDAERVEILDGWNRTEVAAAITATVPARIATQAAERPDSIAVVCGTEYVTYSELNARADRLTRRLRRHGIGPERTVGVLLDRSPDLIAALLAVLKAGGVYVPLDPTYPEQRLRTMIADSKMTMIVTSRRLASALPDAAVAAVFVESVDEAATSEWGPTPHSPDADQLAYVVYTSGSTGTPKGVAVSHGALCNLVDWHLRTFHVTSDDRGTVVASVGFDASVWEIWPYLVAGAQLHVLDDATRLTPAGLWSWLGRAGATVAFLPTPLAESAFSDPSAASGVALRALLTGGDRLVARPDARWPFVVVNNYGPTENTVVSTSGRVAADPAGSPPSIGRPIDNVQVYVLDSDMSPVPIGVPGELFVGGRSLARGYLGRPAQTAAAFVPDPFGRSGGRLYRTGDIVQWNADGTLAFIGRRDDQVKVRGHRIELGEIEAAVMRVPGVVRGVAVLAGAGDQRRVVAYFTSQDGRRLDPVAVRAALRRELPSYMVPAAVVPLESLPLTANGKIDRHRLPEPAVGAADSSKAAAPQSTVEALLCGIWCEVLRVDQVGRHDNFFDVGGDSILSIQIAARAARAGLPLSPRLLFQHQTIAELAAVAGSETRHDVAQGPISGESRLTPIQHWFFEQDLAQPQHFNQSVLLELLRPIPIVDLERALDSLMVHHDALRSRFVRSGREWTQRIDAAACHVSVETFDLTTRHDADKALADEANRIQAGLDLGDGPLVRAAVFDRGPDAGRRLLIVIHHLVVDAVSWRILLDDLHTVLEQIGAGLPIALPPKTTSMREWAERLDAHTNAGVYDAQSAFWSTSRPSSSRLPVDNAGGESLNTVGASSTVTARLSADETDALLKQVPALAAARVHEVLLAATALAIREWSGCPYPAIDVEAHGRQSIFTDVDLSRTVGWCTTMFPVEFDLTDAEPATAVRQAKERLRSGPGGGLAFGALRYLRRAGPAAEQLRAMEPAQISFNYLGRIDHGLPELSAFRLATEDAGATIGSANARRHLLEVNARIQGGVLQMGWTFCPLLHDRRTIEGLAERCAHLLRQLITIAARTPERLQCAADYPAGKLDRQTFDLIADRYRRQGIADICTLGPLQRGMLVHSLAAPESGAFVTQIELVFEGSLDADVLRAAWTRLQEHHPVLRTTITEIGGGDFRQVITRRAPLSWTTECWGGVAHAEAADRLRSFLEADRRRGFALDEPLSRVALIDVNGERHHLTWTHHHALLDGWSMVMLLEDLVGAYEECLAGREPVFEDRPPYRQYLEWLERQDPQASEAFWRAHLAGFRTATRLSCDRSPAGRVRSAVQIDEQELSVDDELTRAIAEFASRQRLTMNTIVQGVWALLLSRYSGDREVVFGTAVAGRPAELPDAERTIGLFLNGVPLRVVVDADAPVASWLADIQQSHVEIRQHEHASLTDIQSWSDVPQGQPLFETTIAFESYPVGPTLAARTRSIGLVDFRLVAHTSTALHLRVVPGHRVRLMLSHDRERFDEQTAGLMLRQFRAVLRQIVDRPDQAVRELSLVENAAPTRGSDAVEVEWRGGVHQQVRVQAKRTPARVAVCCGDARLTYRELDERASRLAARLMSAGVRREQTAAVYAERGIGLVTSMLAILEAGGAFTILDSSYPPARTLEQLEIAGVDIVVHARNGRVIPDFLRAWTTGSVRRQIVSADDCSIDAAPDFEEDAPDPDRPAYVAFTSGSAGKPKAIVGRHASLARYGWSVCGQYGMDAEDRFAMLSALSHDPLLRDVFPPLQIGATLCIPPASVFDVPGAIAEWAAAEQVTAANLTPAMAQLIFDGGGRWRIPSLRHVFFVGEPLTTATVARVRNAAPVATCVNLYGSTETQQALGSYQVPDDWCDTAPGVVPVGRGMAGVELLVVRDGRHRAGVGEIGEIWVRSPLLARGYLGDPALTARRFLVDPLGPSSGRVYRTGDLGRYLPGGNVVVLGRADDQIKIRGFRIEPAEIESFLLEQPGVREAAVVAAPRADGGSTLVAFVAGSVDPTFLRGQARSRFPEHMVPARFASMSELPRTSTGKVDRGALAASGAAVANDCSYAAPRSAIEQELAELWADELKVERVGVDDSFFELGGHSLLAARLVSRIRDAFTVDLKISDLFERPRVGELAPFVEQLIATRQDAIAAVLDEVRGLSSDEIEALLAETASSTGEAAG